MKDQKDQFVAMGCSAEQAEMFSGSLSGASPDQLAQFSLLDPETRDWLFGLLKDFGKAAGPALLAAMPYLVAGDWKAAIREVFRVLVGA